jgi:hypothetical protein
MRAGWLVVALAAAAAVGGCGRDADRDAVQTVTDRFHAALEAGDGETACAQLSADTRTELESQEQEACPEAVTSLQVEGGALTRLQVYVTNAKADLASGESAFLSRTQEGWRISAVGCTPQQGKPADIPYDCELEA